MSKVSEHLAAAQAELKALSRLDANSEDGARYMAVSFAADQLLARRRAELTAQPDPCDDCMRNICPCGPLLT